MALSQIQCLDDNHVNARTHEAKPEFFYCENQRLALEALLRDGPEAFGRILKARGVRGFLSDAELRYLEDGAERWDPGAEPVYPLDAELGLGDGEDMEPLSSHYWPDLSDTSVPRLELGWPDAAAYRGVTRATVYAQPPLEGSGHIKEVVRKAIAQAQKVIAVVMDVFTDVDIFRDILDAGFKRRVAVYILLERTALPHFLSMCRRADMHVGHLKNLRVRSTGGVDLITQCSTKVSGRLGHRFMFVDGDKALSGSYNFTWMSSRLEKHLLNVITGQAVDTFDRLFRELYSTSGAVDLRPVATEVAPEPEPLLVTVAPERRPSADLARKLYSPKYALVAAGRNSSSSPASSDSPKDSNSAVLLDSGKNARKASLKAAVEPPPLHPGLAHLEKAYLIPYLPTWPEPDPPSDVIGFINIIDSSRPVQVHLQRSEMFGTSQAIRFSSPFSAAPEQSPPEELAQPKQFSKYKDIEDTDDADQEQTQLNSGPSELDPKALPTGQDVQTHTDAPTHAETDTTKVDAPLIVVVVTNASTSLHSGCRMLTELTHSVSTTSSATVEPLPVVAVHTKPVSSSTHTPEHDPAQTSDPCSSRVNARPKTLRTEVVSKTYRHAEAVVGRMSVQPLCPPHPSSITTPPVSTSSVISASVSTSFISSVVTTPASTPVSSLSSSSSPLHVALPVPKPRTVQLVIKDGAGRAGVEVFSEISVVKRTGAAGPLGPGAGPLVQPATQTQPGADVVVRRSDVPNELQSKSRIKTGAQTNSKEECYNMARQTGADVSNEICNAVTGAQSHRQDSQEEGTRVTPRETRTHEAQTHISSSDKLQKENVTVKGTRRTECETAILLTDTNRVTAKPSSQTRAEVTGRPSTKRSEAPNEDTTKPKEVLRTNGKGGSFENGLMQPQNNKGLMPDVVNFVNHKAGTTTHDSFSATNHVVQQRHHHPDVGTPRSQVMKQNVAGVVVQPTAAADVSDSTVHTSTEHGTLQNNSQARSGVKGASRRLESDVCTPTTPDSRTTTQTPPDFRVRTPTSSDGCVSPPPRDDSALSSTTSEEYYDSYSDSGDFPSCDPVTITTAPSATASPVSTNTTTSTRISTSTSTAAAATRPVTTRNTATASTATHVNAAPTTTRRPTNTTTTTHPPVTTTTAPFTTTTRATTVSSYVSTTSTSIDSSAHVIRRGSSTASPPIKDGVNLNNDTRHTCVSTRATSPPLAASIVLSLSYTPPPPADSQVSSTNTTPTPITASSPMHRTPVVLAKPVPLVAREPAEERAMSPNSLRWRIEEEQTEREGPVCEMLTPANMGLGGLCAGEKNAAQGSFTGTKKRRRESPAHSVRSVESPANSLRSVGSPAHSVRSVDLSSHDRSKREGEEESPTEEDMQGQTDLSSGCRERLVSADAADAAAQTPAALGGPGAVDKRDRPPSARETAGKKLLRLTYGLPSQSRTPQTSRPARPLNPPQTAKAAPLHHSGPQTHDNTPAAPRRVPPPRKAPLMPVGQGSGTAAGSRRQEEPHGTGSGTGGGSRRQEEPHSGSGTGSGSRRQEEPHGGSGTGAGSRRQAEEPHGGSGTGSGSRRQEEEPHSGSGTGGGSRRQEEPHSGSGTGSGSRRQEEEPHSGSGTGSGSRRQAEEPHSRSTTPHSQPPGTAAAPGRTRTGQTQNQNQRTTSEPPYPPKPPQASFLQNLQPPYPKPQASFLHSHSKVPPAQSQVVLSPPQNQPASSQNQPASSQAQPASSQVQQQRPGSKQGSVSGGGAGGGVCGGRGGPGEGPVWVLHRQTVQSEGPEGQDGENGFCTGRAQEEEKLRLQPPHTGT